MRIEVVKGREEQVKGRKSEGPRERNQGDLESPREVWKILIFFVLAYFMLFWDLT